MGICKVLFGKIFSFKNVDQTYLEISLRRFSTSNYKNYLQYCKVSDTLDLVKLEHIQGQITIFYNENEEEFLNPFQLIEF
jgi:hypothetical protein